MDDKDLFISDLKDELEYRLSKYIGKLNNDTIKNYIMEDIDDVFGKKYEYVIETGGTISTYELKDLYECVEYKYDDVEIKKEDPVKENIRKVLDVL